MPAAGKYDQRVTLQQKTAGVDALGQDATTWADVVSFWAEVTPLRGREYFAAAQTQSAVDTRIVTRFRTGVLPTMRALWRGQPHEIVSVLPKGQRNRTELELMCIAGVKDGR